MSDLIKRLRALKTLDVHWERLATEAADEIERLREELNVTRLQRDAKLSSQTAVDEAAAREIERLREALEEIAINTPRGNSVEGCRRIAREALNEAP